jgi:predicted Zn-dependent protease
LGKNKNDNSDTEVSNRKASDEPKRSVMPSQSHATDSESRCNVPTGFILEYRIKRLLFRMVYFTKNGIVMKTSHDESAVTITDLDVYGVYIHRDFTIKTIWADCKSGKAKVHERISWIKGIMGTLKINDTIFVKQSVRTEVKKYAKKSNIQIMELSVLDKLERDYNIEQNDWTGSWDYKSQYNQGIIFSKIGIPSNDIYKRIHNFIISDFWKTDPYSNVKKIITALRELSEMTGTPMEYKGSKSIKWAINELISLFVLATLTISREVYYLNEWEKGEIILESLSSREISNKKRTEIFKAAFRLGYSLVQKQVPDYTPPDDIPDINLSPPKYSEGFVDLIMRINNNPKNYYDLLRFLDYVLMEYDLKNTEIDHSELKVIFGDYNNLIKGAKTILHFICQTTGIPTSFFQLVKNG